MELKPVTVEAEYNAPVSKVWKALTDKAEMKQWYFDIAEFKPEPGFKFQFMGGTEDNQYLHKCEIIEVIPQQKLSYTWQYDGYAGNSLVTFHLYAEGSKTRVVLTHSGIETFPDDAEDLVRSNFEQGWHHIITIALPEYLGK
tara:strand:- start:417 stop:842 length:426 start_codon:yes stop_codon:yes gene_type:complete